MSQRPGLEGDSRFDLAVVPLADPTPRLITGGELYDDETGPSWSACGE